MDFLLFNSIKFNSNKLRIIYRVKEFLKRYFDFFNMLLVLFCCLFLFKKINLRIFYYLK